MDANDIREWVNTGVKVIGMVIELGKLVRETRRTRKGDSMEQVTDKRVGTTSTIRAFYNSELQLRIADKEKQGYELVDQGFEKKHVGSRWWAKMKYVGLPQHQHELSKAVEEDMRWREQVGR